MGHQRLDNGEYMMRAYRALAEQQQALNQTNPYLPGTPGEREAEDVTGLRLLEEFLAKRKRDQGE
ncbi:MAG TPA: hypothetical protein VFR19_25355 [Hyphomicrobiaceae bacterium]|jgi:hypothetical protein|nr:hypothetical protein [Hyphomicrobiaceae bacterium]